MYIKNNDIQTLINYIKKEKKNLLCFGAGKTLTEACDFFSDLGFAEIIDIIFDNNKKSFKWGKNEWRILPFEKVSEVVTDNSILYISSERYYEEIYEILSKIEALNGTECYIHEYVKHMPIPYVFIPKSHIIPKKIHFCWFGGKEIPIKNRKWMESWKKYCPDYEIIRWDENNYDYTKNEYMRQAYEDGKYAFVSDCARLEIIYENGGIYLDNDVELLRSLDSLLGEEAFCGTYYSVNGAAFGLGFGGVARFELFNEMYRDYEKIQYFLPDGKRNIRDCLYYQTQVLKKYGYEPRRNTLQKVNGLTIFPTDVLSPMDLNGNMLATTEKTVSIHHFDASWYEQNEQEKFRARKNEAKHFFETHPIIV